MFLHQMSRGGLAESDCSVLTALSPTSDKLVRQICSTAVLCENERITIFGGWGVLAEQVSGAIQNH